MGSFNSVQFELSVGHVPYTLLFYYSHTHNPHPLFQRGPDTSIAIAHNTANLNVQSVYIVTHAVDPHLAYVVTEVLVTIIILL